MYSLQACIAARKPILLLSTMRNLKNKLACHRIFQEGKDDKTVPDMLSPELVLRERPPGLAELGERMVVDVSGIGGRSPCEQ